MQSPWKKIGQIIWGRSPETAPTPAVVDPGTDTRAVPGQPASPVARPSHPDENPVAGKKDLDATAAKAADTREVAPSAVEPREPAAQKAVRPPRVKKTLKSPAIAEVPIVTPERASPKTKTPVKQAAKKAAVDNRAQAVQRGFHGEVTDIDAEVRALRRELAKKLTLQNAQLRKMLERFGVS